MNNIDLLTAQVELYPTNPIVASMLVDALMEERDMHRSESEAHVMRVQEVATDAAFMRFAAELLLGSATTVGWARRRCIEAAGAPAGAPVTLLIVAGLQCPQNGTREDYGPDPYWGTHVITVGGQWLTREYREWRAWVEIGRRERREARRR